MSYENAPATRLLATRCAVCARPLVDAVSVEIGMGPDCREKYGYNEGDSTGRPEANRLVHRVATGATMPETLAIVSRLVSIGFGTLASRLLERKATVEILDAGPDAFSIRTPYNPDYVSALKSACYGSVRWNATEKVWTVRNSAKKGAWEVFQRFFSGQLLLGPKGPKIIGLKDELSASKVDAAYQALVKDATQAPHAAHCACKACVDEFEARFDVESAEIQEGAGV